MELEKHEEIVKWIQDNFPQDKFFRESIVEDLAQFFEKLPDDYLMEYTENPNFVIVKDSNMDGLETRIRRDVILNPFFLMMIIIATRTVYEAITEEIKKEVKFCSKCGVENPIKAKYCMDCGKHFLE